MKTVHLIRHGQATSNEAALELGWDAYALEEHLDAGLTALGRRQSRLVGRQIEALAVQPELVLSSPLTRAMSTADEALAGVIPGAVPRLVLPLLRERLGVNPCDRRRPWSLVAAEHSSLWDASLVETEEDNLWKADERETDRQIEERARAAIEWLAGRPEETIVVFTHSSFIEALLDVHLDEKEYLENGGLRTILVESPG